MLQHRFWDRSTKMTKFIKISKIRITLCQMKNYTRLISCKSWRLWEGIPFLLFLSVLYLLPSVYYHCPQTKFAKVMFLHVSVILSTGECLPQCMLGSPLRSRHPPRSRPPAEQTPPRADTPREQTPPCAVHAGRYSQQEGGMYPTGMQSC